MTVHLAQQNVSAASVESVRGVLWRIESRQVLACENCTSRGRVRMDALNTEVRTRERFEKTPFIFTPAGREAFKQYIPQLAAYMARKRPPKGLETVLRGFSRRRLAFMAL